MRAALICVFAGILFATIPFVPESQVYVMVCLMFLCLIGPAWYEWQRGSLDYFETIHVIGFIYFVFFGMGAVWTLGDPVNIAYDRYLLPYIPQATLYCLLGYLALLAGYYGPWSGRKTAWQFREYPRGTLFLFIPGAIGLVGLISEAAWHWSTKLAVKLSAIVSTCSQFAPLYIFAWALAWIMFFSGQATRGQRRLLLFVFCPATAMLLFLLLNNKSITISLAGVPLIALWYARRHVPWTTLIVLVLVLVFVIFPFHNTYRLLDARMSTSQRVSLTSSIIGDWSYNEYMLRSMITVKQRLSLINSVAVVIRDVGRWVPYAKGETLFLPTLVFFVPRLLWPDKPMLTFGREFGQKFRVVRVFDKETAIASSVPGELYWNFDLVGILVGMALWGMAMRFFYRRYGEAGELNPIRMAVHIALLINFAHFEGGLAFQTVGLIRTLLIIEGYRWISLRMDLVDKRPPGSAATKPIPVAS